ncbi:MAG: ATP-dependent DNA helicase, partial [Candidatus Cloacimonadaceae bacterium]|nr:ATP-dependent DNA helicase [Candidatus Cloacimonadaceae bacterium]
DEAHNLMATAAKSLGFEIGYADIVNLFNNLSSAHKRRQSGFLHLLEFNLSKSLIPASGKEHISAISKNLETHLDGMRKIILALFSEAGLNCEKSGSFGKLRIKRVEDYCALYHQISALVKAWKDFQKELRALSNVLSSFNGKQVPNYDNLIETSSAIEMRAAEMEGGILAIESPALDYYALWIENNPKPDRNIPSASICYAPIEVGDHLKRMLYDNVPCIVFTSATLALRGSFKYFYAQSGLNLIDDKRISEAIVESPFDFDTQSRLMVASFLPEHKDSFFINQALGCIEQILTSTNVGTMILFTSYKDLNAVYDHIGDTLYHNNRPFYAQGKAGSRSSILEEFKRHGNAVLLGTNSFWEGVDIQGESLSLLILFKIPFQVPSEPIVEAFIDKLERENKDSFMHYMLPNALLKLRQGFGRLIRSRRDRGIVLIMDSRVSNKRYGEYFKQVLPTACVETKNELELISGIARFFNAPPGGGHRP